MRKFLLLVLLLLFTTNVQASYVLPYPSYMPGHALYRFSRLLDQAKHWWYQGTLSSVKYHQRLADKYLVEAKILFEYQQYLLALDALARSNKEITRLAPLVVEARKQGKEVSWVREAMATHIETLERIKQTLPIEFTWQEENKQPIQLLLHQRLDEAKEARTALLNLHEK